jgi:hypothetical protein
MNVLSSTAYETARRFVETLAPPVDRSLFEHHVRGDGEEDIAKALAAHQNPDGGFGKGLEMDFTYPGSSPMSTSVALQTLVEHDSAPGAREMARAAVRYLEQTYDTDREGWLALPRETKDYPHAPWWDVDANTGMCDIDNHWGNPSAEITGYLYRYRDLLETLDADDLIEAAISRLESITEYESFHEMFCFIRMARQMPPSVAAHMHSLISRAVSDLVSTDPAEWGEYVAKPLDFAPLPDSDRYGIGDAAVEANLDYLVEKLERDGCVSPTWEWAGYKDVWMAQKVKWVGALTSRALVTLKMFGRLDV